MTAIVSVHAHHLAYQLADCDHLAWTGGRIQSRHAVLIEICDGDGRMGWGEISETYLCPQIYAQVVNDPVCDFLQGQDAAQIDRIHNRLKVFLISLGWAGLGRAVLSGIDLALHNLNESGETVGVRIPVYASMGFAHQRDELIEDCRKILNQGFETIKIRGAMGVAEDIERIRCCREAFGSAIRLILDLGQPYTESPYTFDQVLQISRGIENRGVIWIEEPFWPEDITSYEKLCAATTIPIACGENLYTEEQFKRWGTIIDICQPDVARVGGLTSLRRIAGCCRKLAPHQFGTSVSLHALCRVAHQLDCFEILEIDLLANPIREVIFKGPLKVEEGHLVMDLAPLGPDLLESIKQYKVTSPR